METSENMEDQNVEIKPFQLLRYFSFSSLIAFVIVVFVLGFWYRQAAENDLVQIGESKNVALTKIFSNSIYPDFAEFLQSIENLKGDEIRAHPETENLRRAVLEGMQGLTVLKVKIYSLDGNTLFSTEASQIGDDKSGNEGFISARSGEAASELTHRDQFSAFEDVIFDRDVIAGYAPIYDGLNIVGVFEVYDDVTPLLEKIEVTQRYIVLGVVTILAVLWITLYLIVRKADRMIIKQHKEQIKARKDILQANDDLELINRRRSRANEFFRATLDHMISTIRHGSTEMEQLKYLDQIKQEFSTLD